TMHSARQKVSAKRASHPETSLMAPRMLSRARRKAAVSGSSKPNGSLLSPLLIDILPLMPLSGAAPDALNGWLCGHTRAYADTEPFHRAVPVCLRGRFSLRPLLLESAATPRSRP